VAVADMQSYHLLPLRLLTPFFDKLHVGAYSMPRVSSAGRAPPTAPWGDVATTGWAYLAVPHHPPIPPFPTLTTLLGRAGR